MALSVVFLAVILEATRRAGGLVLFAIVTFFVRRPAAVCPGLHGARREGSRSASVTFPGISWFRQGLAGR